jgi:glycosyltransferase involved in cell wall biosynthesis
MVKNTLIIVIFSPGFPPWNIGGEEYYAYYQTKELSELGNEVHVIARNIGNTAECKDKPSTFYSLLARFSSASPEILQYSLTTISIFFAFLKLHIRPNLIHAHDPYGEGLAAIMVKKIFGTPVVITWHAAELVDTTATFSIVGDACRRVVLKNANDVIVNSEFFKELAVKAVSNENLGSKMCIISPGVDVNKFKPTSKSFSIAAIPSDSQVILAVCRLEKIKGLDILIRTAPHVLKQFPKAHFVLVGSGSERANLENLSRELKVSENIVFAGAVSGELLPVYYSACDVFTVPTRGEGFGMAFLEAWSSGKPIIVTENAPEIAKLVRKYGGGFVVSDDPQGLAKAIIELLSNQTMKNEMGKIGRRIALTQYSWRKTAFDIYRTYKIAVSDA